MTTDVKLTARLNKYSTTTKIHLATCGSIPVDFTAGDDAWGVDTIELDGKEGKKIPFKLYHSGANYWMQPLPPKYFVIAIAHVARKIRKDMGIKPSPCATCKSYTVINIKHKNNKWWLELKEEYK